MKLKSFNEFLALNEYYVKSISDFKKYLSLSNEEKQKDLPSKLPDYTIADFVNQYKGFTKEEKKRLNNNPYDYENFFNKEIYKDFYYYIIDDYLDKDDEILSQMPSWHFLEFKNTVKNQWLIHFSNFSLEIQQEQKFKYGVDDLTKLGLTSWLESEYKQKGGYNFGYDLKDAIEYGFRTDGSTKYGKSAVIFRASGIKCEHFADNEDQVIFQGNTATNINRIYKENYKRCINDKKGNKLISFESLEKLLQRFDKNYTQYSKQLY